MTISNDVFTLSAAEVFAMRGLSILLADLINEGIYYPNVLTEPSAVNTPPVLITVKENISVLLAVPAGAEPPNQLIVTAEPFTVNALGIKGEPPCVTIIAIPVVVLPVLGTFVIAKEKLAPGEATVTTLEPVFKSKLIELEAIVPTVNNS
tara:strand:- start:77 stop:526 length:450 start_codon:yes stop_codon:yes gene_type:complete